MIVYIVPETNLIAKVTIKSEEDDMVTITSDHVAINPKATKTVDKYIRVVHSIALYTLKNYGLNKNC